MTSPFRTPLCGRLKIPYPILNAGIGPAAGPELAAAWVHPAFKKRIVEATADDTVLNELYDYDWPNAPHRTLRNKAYAEWQSAGCPARGAKPGEGTSIGHGSNTFGERTGWMRYSVGTAPLDFDGDIEYAPLWAGDSVSNVNDILPAAEIIRSRVRDAEADLISREQS